MGKSILIVAFEEEKMADKALHTLGEMYAAKQFEISDAVVITKDFQGHVQARETGELTPKKGAITGGIAGLVIGTLLGGPVGGALLGTAAGAIAGKAVDLGVPNEKIIEIGDHMDQASSTLILVLKSGDKEKLAAALEATGGKSIEMSLSDDIHDELEESLSDRDGSRPEE